MINVKKVIFIVMTICLIILFVNIPAHAEQKFGGSYTYCYSDSMNNYWIKDDGMHLYPAPYNKFNYTFAIEYGDAGKESYKNSILNLISDSEFSTDYSDLSYSVASVSVISTRYGYPMFRFYGFKDYDSNGNIINNFSEDVQKTSFARLEKNSVVFNTCLKALDKYRETHNGNIQ